MREVKFTKDFATHKKGETKSFDSMLSSDLVHRSKVAEYTDNKKKKAEPKAKATPKAK